MIVPQRDRMATQNLLEGDATDESRTVWKKQLASKY